MTEKITYTCGEDGIAYLTINRPEKRNAFDETMIGSLLHYLNEAKQNHHLRALVIRGTGEHFCAGADVVWMQKMAQYTQEENFQDAMQLGNLMHQLFYFPKPTLAVVQGSAFAGGAGIAACADIVIAADNAKFCFSEVRLGLVPAVISPFVSYKMGHSNTQRYFLTAEVISANVAKELGLCHVVASETELDNYLQQFLRNIKRSGPRASTAVKSLLRSIYASPIDHIVLETTAHHIATLRVSPEGQEGLNAFLEKRAPSWEVK
jgi:methylglutaconyl-CoA hydratase